MFLLTYLHVDSKVSQVLVLNSFQNDLMRSATVQQKGDFARFFACTMMSVSSVASCQARRKRRSSNFFTLVNASHVECIPVST